ncbi:MAG: hypothetical protein DMG67_09380 [Acidobacteria bacterium]|nr:MAG: hypothetical protein DMG67_09380 [Acidobacteriota bacterium]
MSTIAVERPEPDAAPEKAKANQQASAAHPLDKFAEDRRTKKKIKRARHRAKLRRSNTNG